MAAAMTGDADRTLREAMPAFLAASGISTAAGRDADHWYPGRGLLHVRLPNFAWRRQAIACHDAHHLLTGLPCTPAGEMQMAAWEFAAGRYPHACATAFCLPLVGLGALLLPGRTFRAFVRGRRSQSLYSVMRSRDVFGMPLEQLRRWIAPEMPLAATWRDRLAFIGLAAASLALLSAPAIVIAFGVAALAGAY